jgi:hypothetical protein
MGANSFHRFSFTAAGGELRPILDCLSIPARPVTPLAPGSQQSLAYEIGNGASHVGPCTAVLINLDSNQQTPLPDVTNCVSNLKAYPFTVPNVSCPKCVIKVSVRAEHLGPNNPEFYDSCLDVSIGGSGEPTAPEAPAVPSTPTAPTSVPQPDPTPVQGVPTPVQGVPTPVPGVPTPVPAVPTPVEEVPTPVGEVPAPEEDVAAPVEAVPTPVHGGPAPVPSKSPKPHRHRGMPSSRFVARSLRGSLGL